MFRSTTIPQRRPFCQSTAQIIEDIEAIKDKEEERNKLYYCLDEKPPQEHKFSKIEEFLRGTNNLESISEDLADLVDEIENLSIEINEHVKKFKEKSNNVLRNNK